MWKLRKLLNTDTVKCNLCGHILTAKGGNNSSKCHLVSIPKLFSNMPSIHNFLVLTKLKIEKSQVGICNQVTCHYNSIDYRKWFNSHESTKFILYIQNCNT